MSRTEYAERVCEIIGKGGPRYPEKHGDPWGWGDYLARWLWLHDKGLDKDP
jgi:hypothetical protein